jgi:predicted nucleic acid-binding Zn ribbon protein
MSRRPRKLGEVITAWLASSGLEKGLGKGRLLDEWESLVGPRIAAVSRPVDVRGETLLLEVEDPSWRSELSMMQERLLETISERQGLPGIKRIRFIARVRSRDGRSHQG